MSNAGPAGAVLESVKRQRGESWLVRYSRWRYARARRGKRNCGECLRPVPARETWCREHSTPQAAQLREEQRAQWVREQVQVPEWAA